MKMEDHQRLKAAIVAVVENQLDANDPPAIKDTLQRLMADGYSEQEGKELIGNVVVAEIFEVLKAGKPFDLARYVNSLHNLPELPILPDK